MVIGTPEPWPSSQPIRVPGAPPRFDHGVGRRQSGRGIAVAVRGIDAGLDDRLGKSGGARKAEPD